MLFVADAGDASTPPWINHDVAFHSWLGWEMLGGARLYVDFNDSNPPGSQFLQAGLVALGDLLSAPDFVVLHGFVVLLGLGGLLVLWHTFRADDDVMTAALVSFAYLVVIVRGNFSNNLYAAGHLPYDFGERDHLFSLVFLPYLLWRLNNGGRSPWMHPWLLAVGFVSVFKPYWALFVLACEVVIWTFRRKRDLAVWASVAAGMALPYLMLLLHSPASFRAFFGEVLPFQLSGSYEHYATSFTDFVASPFHLQMLFGALLFLAAWIGCFRRRLVDRTALLLLAALVAGAYLSIVHQHKFWSYHAMLFFALVIVGGAFVFGRLAGGWRRGAWGRILAGVVAVLLVGVTGISMGSMKRMLADYGPLGYPVVPLIEGRERVMFFSMSVDYSFAPLHRRVRTVGPWSVHMVLPALLATEDEAERHAALDRYAARVSARIDETRPELLIFAPYTQALPEGVTLHGLMVDLGVLPREDYRRRPDLSVVSIHPGLAGWIVYEREGAS